jgi:1-phosphatidylinositol-3-phosphate 5-kinase
VDDAKASCLTAYDSAATEDAQAPTNATEDEQVLRAPLQLDCQMIAEDESSLPTTRARFQMTAYYAPHFATLRKLCVAGGEESYLASMRRCVPWAAQGGKSNVFFAKTRDGRYIIKQLTKVEKQSVLEYAPDYFKHLEASLMGDGTSCLAKILGIYQVRK